MGDLRSVVPTPIRRPLGHVLRTCEAPFYYLRAKRILNDYTEHYHQAQRQFLEDGNVPKLAIESLSEVGVQVISPGATNNLLHLSADYLSAVERVAAAARARLSRASECSFFPALTAGPLPEDTEHIPAVQSGETIAIQLKEPLSIEGLEELCGPLMLELEKKIYCSYAMIDKVYVYRSPVSNQVPQGSWLWHYDNHPNEVLKLMIYLTDVSEHGGPFQYLRSKETQQPVWGSLSPLYGTSRVSPETVRGFLADGCESHKVVGPLGTLLLFDNNVIHKASIATDMYRDVLILQVRPTIKKQRPFIDTRWTGSFQHAPFNRNPAKVQPTTRRLRHFS